MSQVSNNPHVFAVCGAQGTSKLPVTLSECITLMESIKAGLGKYLDGKRVIFPRFYFLSDEEMLDIISTTRDIKQETKIPHLRKIFHGIASVDICMMYFTLMFLTFFILILFIYLFVFVLI
jgi:dynein heavy chain